MAPNQRRLHRMLQVVAIGGWVLAALGFTSVLPTPWLPDVARGIGWILVVVHPIEMVLFAPALRRRGRLDAANLLCVFVFGGIHMLGVHWSTARGEPA